MIADLVSLPLLLGGAFFVSAGTVGLLRFPDVFSRVHAVTKADTAGLGLLATGLAVREQSLPVAARLALVVALVLLASATCSYLLAREARRDLERER